MAKVQSALVLQDCGKCPPSNLSGLRLGYIRDAELFRDHAGAGLL
jgi:hypothetical protein